VSVHVCSMITFKGLDVLESSRLICRISTGVTVKYVYVGHWVKVKVIAVTKREIPNPHNVNLQSSITPVLQMIKSCEVCIQLGVFEYGESNGVTAIFVT